MTGLTVNFTEYFLEKYTFKGCHEIHGKISTSSFKNIF